MTRHLESIGSHPEMLRQQKQLESIRSHPEMIRQQKQLESIRSHPLMIQQMEKLRRLKEYGERMKAAGDTEVQLEAWRQGLPPPPREQAPAATPSEAPTPAHEQPPTSAPVAPVEAPDSAAPSADKEVDTTAPAALPEALGLDPFRTGTPGRPTGAELVLAEFRRRLEAGEITPRPRGLSECAEQLATWYETERRRYAPPGPPLSGKRIQPIIRDEYRRATPPQ
jgi:hypothetical protein